jgi:8-oxo-dGTP pyrophosphatase MutT (NUDIX family)
MTWHAHVTVATVVEREGRFLLVRERQEGRPVINQPAGHLEPGETLLQAARREVLEETGWRVEIEALLALGLFTSPRNGVTYYRTTFIGRPLAEDTEAERDPKIEQVLWLSAGQMRERESQLRSPLVLDSVERYLRGERYPLDMIY